MNEAGASELYGKIILAVVDCAPSLVGQGKTPQMGGDQKDAWRAWRLYSPPSGVVRQARAGAYPYLTVRFRQEG
ncbi:hypothetical protein [Holophaga foetida]|uniref:hypothetical protein n=1 Tax=Holophaga foetida TaxID=35839 RepID=UPI0011DC7798|nr:hypothetical protein [Holophaga foetida]